MSDVTLAIDAMGGDFGPKVTVPAALDFLQKTDQANVRLIFVGREDLIQEQIHQFPLTSQLQQQYDIVAAQQVVGMDEKPAEALRKKKQSSMRIAINQVKEGKADACISAGNTGALMATSRFVLKTVPGIDRPAIVTAIPGLDTHFYMLDLGANVDCTANQLQQFADMGALLFESLEGRAAPRVGLLNIGSEDIKGNEQIKAAHDLIQSSTNSQRAYNYIGFIEADSMFFGEADVVVCDGFVGNVSLKSMEGVAKMMAGRVKAHVKSSLWLQLTGLLTKPAWSGLKKQLDPGRYNGASLIGLLGTVVKSHGGADRKAFRHAIQWASDHVSHQVPQQLMNRFATTPPVQSVL